MAKKKSIKAKRTIISIINSGIVPPNLSALYDYLKKHGLKDELHVVTKDPYFITTLLEEKRRLPEDLMRFKKKKEDFNSDKKEGEQI